MKKKKKTNKMIEQHHRPSLRKMPQRCCDQIPLIIRLFCDFYEYYENYVVERDWINKINANKTVLTIVQ